MCSGVRTFDSLPDETQSLKDGELRRLFSLSFSAVVPNLFCTFFTQSVSHLFVSGMHVKFLPFRECVSIQRATCTFQQSGNKEKEYKKAFFCELPRCKAGLQLICETATSSLVFITVQCYPLQIKCTISLQVCSQLMQGQPMVCQGPDQYSDGLVLKKGLPFLCKRLDLCPPWMDMWKWQSHLQQGTKTVSFDLYFDSCEIR